MYGPAGPIFAPYSGTVELGSKLTHPHPEGAALTVQVSRSATGRITLDVTHPRPDQALSSADLIAVGHAIAATLTRMASR